MEYHYDDFRGRKRNTNFWKGVLLGIAVGCLLVAVVFFYFAGTIISQENRNDSLTPPAAEENRANRENTNVEIPQEAREYYLAVVEAAERVTPSVVGISNYGMVYDFWGRGQQQERATGSGVIIDPNGLIVTNYHVIEGAEELIVTMGSGEEFPAEIIGADPPTDLAVLKVDKDGLPAAELADSDNLRAGEPAIAIGNPLGLDFQQTVTQGVISASKRSITIQGQKFTFIQTDAAINDGNSGGPLVNIYGKVVGINTAKIKIPGVEGMGFAIPSNTVRDITSALIEEGRVSRPWMGVNISNITSMDAQRFDLAVEEGVLVTGVVPGGPADAAGVQSMDVIMAINGREIKNVAELQHAIYQYSIGQTIDVTLLRENEETVLPVTLGELPEQLN